MWRLLPEAPRQRCEEAEERLKAFRAGLGSHLPEVMDCLDAGFPAASTFYGLPPQHRSRIRTTNGVERLNVVIKRRTRAVGAFWPGQRPSARHRRAPSCHLAVEFPTLSQHDLLQPRCLTGSRLRFSVDGFLSFAHKSGFDPTVANSGAIWAGEKPGGVAGVTRQLAGDKPAAEAAESSAVSPLRVGRVPRQRGHAIGGQPREGHVAVSTCGRAREPRWRSNAPPHGESHVVGQRPDSRGGPPHGEARSPKRGLESEASFASIRELKADNWQFLAPRG